MIEKFPFLLEEKVPLTEELVESVKEVYKIVNEKCDGRLFSHSKEAEIRIYHGLRALFSASGMWKKLGDFYARRVLRYLDPKDISDYFAMAGIWIEGDKIPLKEYLKIPHIFPETKIYHLPVEKGYVFLSEEGKRYFAADVAFWLSTRGLPEEVPDWVRKYAVVRKRRRSGAKWKFFEDLLSASGIPDGRKRIIYYWLMPYLVSIKGESVEKAVETVKEWVGRQGGGKILESWIRSEAENVKKKGIKPWSLDKVRREDPGLVGILKEVGLLE